MITRRVEAVKPHYISVDSTLQVIVFFEVSEESPLGRALAINRKDGGRVLIRFEEVRGLVAALTEGRARLYATIKGQAYESDLPF